MNFNFESFPKRQSPARKNNQSSASAGFMSNFWQRIVGGPSSTRRQRMRQESLGASERSNSPTASELSLDSNTGPNNTGLNNTGPENDVQDPFPFLIEQGIDPIQMQMQMQLQMQRPFYSSKRSHSVGISRDYWMSDGKVTECYDCKMPFSTFRRRHHCRICGQIFCHKCASNTIPGEPLGYQDDLRVCDFCLNVMGCRKGSYDPDAASASLVQDEISPSIDTPEAEGSWRMLHKNSFRVREDNKIPENTKHAAGPFRRDKYDDTDEAFGDQQFAYLLNDMDQNEDYSSFTNANKSFASSSQLPRKSFVLPGPDSERTMALEPFPGDNRSATSFSLDRKRSPLLPNRRKFSHRSFHRYIPNGSKNSLDRNGKVNQTAINSLELNAASINHIDLLMDQMLKKFEIASVKLWKPVLVLLLFEAARKLNPDIRNGDEIDIRNYVKIKRIPGGNISDSFFVSGVVASKKPLHKKMLKPIVNPRILLLTFPLEYQRVENEFVSLGTLMSQEREHLRNLVNRLILLQPDVILVEKTVARIALEILLESNIVVIPNVKISLLLAVARCTGADIVNSIDKLSAQKIGMCEQFSFKTFINSKIPDYRKTFIFFDGVPEHLGCTLILRGGSMKELEKVKELTEFLVFAVYSLKLEGCLFQDSYSMNPSIPENEEEANSPTVPDKATNYGITLGIYEKIILSVSPNVHFPAPYVLKKTQAMGAESQTVHGATEEMIADVPFLLNAQRLSPSMHQNIVVLFSSHNPQTTVPCSSPRPHLIEYYGDSDLTIGQFIEDTCLGSNLQCTAKGCESPTIAHYRTYSHASAQLIVSVDSLACPVQGMENRIIMWANCKICSEATPFIPMSESSWKYSFGKYLELSFYHSPLETRSHSCQHDLLRDYMRFFAFRNLAIRFEYKPITLYEVAGPPMHREPRTQTIVKLRLQDAELLKSQIVDFYTSVLERIQFFVYDIVAPAKTGSSKETMAEFSRKALAEKKLLLQLLQQTLIACAPTDGIAINAVYRALHFNVIQWDQDFAAFIRNYLQTDTKEIRRVTAAQIKRIFDRDPASIDTRHAIFPESHRQEGAEKAEPIDQSKLPSLYISNDLLASSDESEILMKRRYSISSLDSNQHRLPSLLDSPTLHSSSILENDKYLQSASFSIPRAISSGPSEPSGPLSNNLEENDDENSTSGSHTNSSTLQWKSTTRSRPNSLRFELEAGKYGEEENADGWNSFSGVAGESERDKNHFESNPDARPTSIMKTITNIWNGNPGNFMPLIYPVNVGEHIFPDSLIIVREDEPSSIVSFALSSVEYQQKLQAMRANTTNTEEVSDLEPSTSSHSDPKQRVSVELEDAPGVIGDNPDEPVLKATLDTGIHVRYQIWDGPTKLHCKIYFTEQFDALRRNCGVADVFEQSLARSMRWDASGGKSGTFFMKTRDDWLVVKKLSPIELEALISFSPAYFEYMSQAFFHQLPTVLAKIFGFYHVGFRNPTTRKTVKMDIVVMENIFFERQNLSKIFDLKGSERNRHVQYTGKQNEVLLDNNLLELIFDCPLFIREHAKKVLRASVYNDTLFLSKLNVMDYSLLVGIHEETQELVVGIVDFIRTYTWDKKLESFVKETGLLGGGKQPTIITPRQYKNRFREAMERYFLMVPDKFVIAGNIQEENTIS